MKLQIMEEPQLAFHQGKLHVDIRAGLSNFGAFDKGSTGVPVPIRIGVIGTTATVDGVRDWLEQAQVDGKPWGKKPPAPSLPADVIDKTAAKYREALTRLTS